MKSNTFTAAALALTLWATASARTTFLIFNDTHVSPGYHTEEGLKKAIKEIPDVNPDVVIINGDLTNEGSDAELENYRNIISEIKHPLFIVPGNHENNWSQSAGKTYTRIFGADRFEGVVGPDSIIIVGTNCGPYMRMGDGHVKQEDLHWMKTVLDSLTTAHPHSRVLSFNHYALNPDLDNYLDYIEFLKPYPVMAHVNGHYHVYNLEKIEGQGDLRDITLTCLDRKNGDYGYSLLEVDGDSIRVFSKLVGAEPQLKYSIKVPEKVLFKKAPGDWKITVNHADSASIFTRPAIKGTNIVYGTSDGKIKTFDLSADTTLWKIDVEAPVYARPIVAGDVIFAPTIDRGILKISAADGSVIDMMPDSLPVVADGLYDATGNKIYLGGYGKMVAFDSLDGSTEWVYSDIDNYCQGEPALAGDNLIFGAWDSYLRNVDTRDGSLKWKWNNGKSSNILGPGNVVPVVYGENIVIVAPDRYMTMIDLETGETLWRDNSYRYRESLGQSADGTKAYAKTMDGKLVAVDMTKRDFTPLWVTDMNIGYEHAPCPIVEVDGYIYAGSRRGIVNVLDGESGELLANIVLGVSEVNGFEPVHELKETGGVTPVAVSLIEGKIATITPASAR